MDKEAKSSTTHNSFEKRIFTQRKARALLNRPARTEGQNFVQDASQVIFNHKARLARLVFVRLV